VDSVKTVSIIQSNYIPWKGYFDIIGLSDEFIILDTVQYTRRDWRNRNRIKGKAGELWLTIPVSSKGKYEQRIDETEIADPGWAERHWKSLEMTYSRLEGARRFGPALRETYEAAAREPMLSGVNRLFLERICGLLGIRTRITSAADYPDTADKAGRIIGLCEAAGATRYISGPAAQNYLDPDAFARRGIELHYMDYAGYPEYPQLAEPFEHGVSVLDLMFCTGERAADFMKFPACRAAHPWPA
jgi:hypothetical protein